MKRFHGVPLVIGGIFVPFLARILLVHNNDNRSQVLRLRMIHNIFTF